MRGDEFSRGSTRSALERRTCSKAKNELSITLWPVNTDNSFKFMFKKKHRYERKEVATVA